MHGTVSVLTYESCQGCDSPEAVGGTSCFDAFIWQFIIQPVKIIEHKECFNEGGSVVLW